MTILFPYRNRELKRIKLCFESLQHQKNKDFKVIFIDYGSSIAFSEPLKNYVSQFSFVDYVYSYCQFQPWSRAKAVNIGIKLVKTDYVFIADIDMIFKENFIDILHNIKNANQTIYFKVGFLNQVESQKVIPFENYKINFESRPGAQGLSLFPTKSLNDICGFDEFLHFWGAEDEDIHNRLTNLGFEEVFYNSEILMLHQWHKSYRMDESKKLSKQLRINNISRINLKRLEYNKENQRTIVNPIWGILKKREDFDLINDNKMALKILNKKENIDHFLFSELPNLKNEVLSVEFHIDNYSKSFKYYLKKILNKTVPQYYTLKQINDKVLLHIISFYHNYNYIYRVSDDEKLIQFSIQK